MKIPVPPAAITVSLLLAGTGCASQQNKVVPVTSPDPQQWTQPTFEEGKRPAEREGQPHGSVRAVGSWNMSA